MSASVFSKTESFRLDLAHEDAPPERVTVQIGLSGLKVLNREGTRTMRSYDLKHIARWQSTGNSLILYTRTPVDLEERQVTLSGDSTTIRSCLDTLTCSCMQ
jgi:hypothetical protein